MIVLSSHTPSEKAEQRPLKTAAPNRPVPFPQRIRLFGRLLRLTSALSRAEMRSG